MLAKETYNTTSDMIYEILVETCGLEISLLADWLSAKSPLDRATFNGHVGYHPNSHFYFLAHPR